MHTYTSRAVICEATYGVSRHLPREQREAHFLQRVTDTLRAGGRVLLPVVALGRAQVSVIHALIIPLQYTGVSTLWC